MDELPDGLDKIGAAALVLSIGFAEANVTRAINGLCDRFGLARSEPNAKAALKMLAMQAIRESEASAAFREAESKPDPT